MQKKAKQKVKFVIDESTPIVEIAERFPKIAEYLTSELGFHCIGCPLMYEETMGEGSMVHGLTPDETKELLGTINKMID